MRNKKRRWQWHSIKIEWMDRTHRCYTSCLSEIIHYYPDFFPHNGLICYSILRCFTTFLINLHLSPFLISPLYTTLLFWVAIKASNWGWASSSLIKESQTWVLLMALNAPSLPLIYLIFNLARPFFLGGLHTPPLLFTQRIPRHSLSNYFWWHSASSLHLSISSSQAVLE